MIPTLSILLICFVLPLQWTASPDPRATGYVLVWGSESRVYDHSIDVGNVTCFDLDGLSVGTNYVSCYARGDAGLISDFCNELIIQKPFPPQNTRIKNPEFQTVLASWDPSPTPDVFAYRIYQSLDTADNFQPVVGTSNTNVIIPGIVLGHTNWFYGTAVNAFGESDPCLPVEYIPQP